MSSALVNPADHQTYIDAALAQAQLRRGRTGLNPAVGAVCVRAGEVIAVGTHYKAGCPHAEVEALQQINDPTHVILYVTLEPCCHQGKTPACTDLIISKGIKTVFFAYKDPNPKVSGQGQRMLQRAGIECEYVFSEKVNAFYQAYEYWQARKKPWVTAKIAISADGKIAGDKSQPLAITQEHCRAFTHQQRLDHSVLLTTATTILNDNPQFNVRLDNAVIKKPLWILDRQLSLSSSSRIMHTAERVTLCHADHLTASEHQSGIDYVGLIQQANRLNLQQLFSLMGAQGIHDCWVEAGGRLLQQLLAQGLVNRLYVYISPKEIGLAGLDIFRDRLAFGGEKVTFNWTTLGVDQVLCIDYSDAADW